MKICYTGGGTMGPVTPLLAVHEALVVHPRTVELAAMWIGTPHGPEQEVVTGEGVDYFSLPVARLPRRPSIEWLVLPLMFLRALWGAWRLLRRERPDVIASAGGYTAVPVCIAARAMSIPIWVHQSDVIPILTNRITAPLATRITVAFSASKRLSARAKVVGNPVRPSVLRGDAQAARKQFEIKNKKPTILVFGGGTGAQWLNKSFDKIAESLTERANVIHLTGRDKRADRSAKGDYHVREFLGSDMADALILADVVVCRAGLGTITELAALSKSAVMVPLPSSPQIANARAVEGACVVRQQHRTSPEELQQEIEMLLENPEQRQELGAKMHAILRTEIADELAEMLLAMG